MSFEACRRRYNARFAESPPAPSLEDWRRWNDRDMDAAEELLHWTVVREIALSGEAAERTDRTTRHGDVVEGLGHLYEKMDDLRRQRALHIVALPPLAGFIGTTLCGRLYPPRLGADQLRERERRVEETLKEWLKPAASHHRERLLAILDEALEHLTPTNRRHWDGLMILCDGDATAALSTLFLSEQYATEPWRDGGTAGQFLEDFCCGNPDTRAQHDTRLRARLRAYFIEHWKATHD
jgi:hypothetical protein